MTDAVGTDFAPRAVNTGEAVRNRLARRYAAERRFKALGLFAVLAAGAFLVLLLSTVVFQAFPAFTQFFAKLPVDLAGEDINAEDVGKSSFGAITNRSIDAQFPFATSRSERRVARSLLSQSAEVILREEVVDDPGLVGRTQRIALPVSDTVDLYLKGLLGRPTDLPVTGAAAPSATSGEIRIALAAEVVALIRQAAPVAAEPSADGSIALGVDAASHLFYLNGGVAKATSVADGGVQADVVIPLGSAVPATAGEWRLARLPPESARTISDVEAVYADHLAAQGLIERDLNWIFFTRGASREPEMAGILGAVVGSFLTMLVTFALSFPVGVAAAVYLEEFAPKNRLTDVIEVNINNLAAVPSIVYGLLGLAVFLNVFGVPRSTPLAGGMVLALMTLPIIIIAARAALKAVPPSIRQGALAVGASRLQTVLHHVMPLAVPGILTGTIIGMALAVGETAPLLMIGMVAFIVDMPNSFVEPATLLPVQIYMWADFPEAAFRQKTAAAIIVLLVFLVIMNGLAIVLRRRFERRW